MMLEKIKKYCARNQLLEMGDTVLIACSGGPDSLALTEILLALRPVYALTLAVGHVNHMFRGAEADADARFVASFCAERCLPYYETKIDVPAYCRAHGLSREEGARAVRYAFLRETAQALSGAKIATGHHRDDQAETVLLHLIRGAGSGGIGGMRAASRGIIRPLLEISRGELAAYCRERGLAPRFDSSNADLDCARNLIRLQLLPELAARYNPAIKDALCRTASLIGAEHAFIMEAAAKAWPQVVGMRRDRLILDCAALNGLHPALRRALLRMALERLRGDLRGIGFDHVERLLHVCAQGRVGTLLELPGHLILRRGYRTAQLFSRDSQAGAAAQDGVRTMLQLPGRTEVAQCGVWLQAVLTEDGIVPADGRTAVFDLAQLALPLYVRRRRAGDRFEPDGMNGTKKLKCFLIDAKVERAGRDRIPLICDQNGILWVGGYRRSRIGKVTGATRRFLRLTIIENETGGEEIGYDE